MCRKLVTWVFILLAGHFTLARATSPAHSNPQSSTPTDTFPLHEVVVSSASAQGSLRNLPMSISVIGSKTIESSNESTVLNIIGQEVPGLFVAGRGVAGYGLGNGAGGQISIRGVGGSTPNNQVLVLVDGTPQIAGLFGHPLPDVHLSSDIERVEVVRGPASILYGSHAMAGAVNLITRRQTHEGFQARARVQYGSFGTQKYMGSGGVRRGGLSIFGSLNHNSTSGHRSNMDYSITNCYLKSQYELGGFSLGADFSIAQYHSSDPGPVHNPYIFGMDATRGRGSFWVKNKRGRVEGAITAYHNFGTHIFTDEWESVDETSGLTAFQSLSLSQRTSITLGADHRVMAGRANSGLNADRWLRMSETAVYSFIKQAFSTFILSGGARLERSSKYGFEVIPQAGLSILLSPSTTVRSSVARGFRSPTLMELYLFAPNLMLEPERLMSFDTSLGHRLLNGRLSFEITGFLINASNQIEVRPNPVGLPPMVRQNVGKFSSRGLEFESRFQSSEHLWFVANYSFTHTNQPRLATPKHQLFVEGSYGFRRFTFSSSVQGIAQLCIGTVNSIAAFDSFALLSAKLAYKPIQHIELQVWGKNLLNQRYSISYGYPMPGVTVFVGISFRFN